MTTKHNFRTIKPFAFDIDHGTSNEPPPSRQQMGQLGGGHVWIGATAQLIPIPRACDPGFEEKMEIVRAALRPKGDT